MSARGEGRIYELLPAFYRSRDAARGAPLKKLLAVIEGELQGLEDDVTGLYENWFIETCEEWIVPYIGDLLGVKGLHPGTPESFSLRAHIANTLAYRRRKGTAAVLEQVARDTTGWHARVVEAFQHLAVSAHVNHPRVEHPAVLSVRSSDPLIYGSGPFDTTARSVDVRSVARGRGRHNLPHVALWLWRLQIQKIAGASARADDQAQGRWILTPWSWRSRTPLFSSPRLETAITQLAQPHNVPGPLLRLPLYREVEAANDGEAISRVWFPDGDEAPVFRVRYPIPHPDSPLESVWVSAPIGPDDPRADHEEGALHTLAICHLDALEDGAPLEDGFPLTEDPGLARLRAWLKAEGRDVGVDPTSGRLVFRAGLTPEEVRVDFATGFPGTLGGGAYRSEEGFDAPEGFESEDTGFFLAFVTRERAPSAFTSSDKNWVFGSLAGALAGWSDRVAAGGRWRGVIALADSRTYEEGALSIDVPAGCHLSIVGARWAGLATTLSDDVQSRAARIVPELAPGGVVPHLRGTLTVSGSGAPEARGRLSLHGLHLEGGVSCPADALAELTLAHVTVVPEPTLGLRAVAVTDGAGGAEVLNLCLKRSILRGVTFAGTGTASVDVCILDSGDHSGGALLAEDGAVTLCASTVRGAVTARTLSATDCLFTGAVTVARRQQGCVRFSFVPPGSRTPRRFRCQPDLAMGTAQHDDALRERLAAAMFPDFVDTEPGLPAAFQLTSAAADAIRAGAEGGEEMGVWGHLRQPQRLDNLRISLATYLRFGLEAGAFLET